MNSSWETPPNGDFASYVERLMAEAARRNHIAQGAHQVQQNLNAGSGAAQSEASAAQNADEQVGAEQARAMYAAPGFQLRSEHPLARGFRQVIKKLESNLQEIAQQQQQQKKK